MLESLILLVLLSSVASSSFSDSCQGFKYQNGSCLQDCPFPYLIESREGANGYSSCNPPCPSGDYYLTLNETCVSSCENKFLRAEDDILYCDQFNAPFGCESIHEFKYLNGSCLPDCPDPYTKRVFENFLFCDESPDSFPTTNSSTDKAGVDAVKIYNDQLAAAFQTVKDKVESSSVRPIVLGAAIGASGLVMAILFYFLWMYFRRKNLRRSRRQRRSRVSAATTQVETAARAQPTTANDQIRDAEVSNFALNAGAQTEASPTSTVQQHQADMRLKRISQISKHVQDDEMSHFNMETPKPKELNLNQKPHLQNMRKRMLSQISKKVDDHHVTLQINL